MKRIGNLKGKPIVDGNPNEIKDNQIHYKEAGGGGRITLSERKNGNLENITAEGSSSNSDNYYYKINNIDLDTTYTLLSSIAVLPSFIIINGIHTMYCITTNTGEILHWLNTVDRLNCLPTAIMILGDSSTFAVESLGELTFIKLPEGDVKIKMISAIEGIQDKPFTEEEKNTFRTMIDTYLQPITREEYFAMVTN